MICLENSHSRVAGKSSSTRTSVSVLRIETGVSANFSKSNQWMKKINYLISPELIKTNYNLTVLAQQSVSKHSKYIFVCSFSLIRVLKNEFNCFQWSQRVL